MKTFKNWPPEEITSDHINQRSKWIKSLSWSDLCNNYRLLIHKLELEEADRVLLEDENKVDFQLIRNGSRKSGSEEGQINFKKMEQIVRNEIYSRSIQSSFVREILDRIIRGENE